MKQILTHSVPLFISAAALVFFALWTAWIVQTYFSYIERATETGVRASLRSLETAAQLYRSDNATYVGVCESQSFQDVESFITQQSGTFYCNSSTDHWSAAAPVHSDPDRVYICVSDQTFTELPSAPTRPQCDTAANDQHPLYSHGA